MFDAMIRALKGPIVVLGAGGFVGANVYRTLSQYRDDVYAVVRQLPSWRLHDVVSSDHVVVYDITDVNATRNLIESLRPQTVLNCTAYGAYSFETNPELIYQTNYLAIVSFIEQLAQYPFAAFVQAGSSSEYGLNCTAPTEQTFLQPNSHYAVSKASLAQYIYYCGVVRQLPVVNLRLYAVYGALEDSSRLIPQVLHHAHKGEYPPFVNPEISRDFVHIDDVCRAFVMAAAKMNPQLYGQSYNIGTGIPTTIRDLAECVRDVFALPKEPVFGTMSDRAWDLPQWYADTARASQELGWQAQIPLADGLRQTMQWIEQVSDVDFDQLSKKHTPVRKRSVTAIIACYKDAQAIPFMYQRLSDTFRSIGCDYEIIFVNDNSPDDSAQVIRDLSLRDHRVIGISHSRNFGSQMAFRSGMELASKDAVVLLDGDLQDPPELIADFYTQWEQGYDVIYGRRVKREMSRFWEFFYKLFYRLFAMFSYIPIPRDAGDFSLIDGKVVRWLLQSPERDLFMRGLRAYMGFKQTGVDYVRPERMFGVSTNNMLKNLNWAKMAFFSYSIAPLNLLTASAFVLMVVSFMLVVFSVVVRAFFPALVPSGITTVLISIIFFGSLNMLGIAILGEYIGKIVIEVKQRPRLIRSAIIRDGVVNEVIPHESR
jgi:nucleoside-diphosphate-sugar epimerase/glycosyltransferase involved in cell wall biosynthesis